jgi:hypothetical protein
MRHYSFNEQWVVPASPAAVHAVLEDVEQYPQWWPQILATVRLGEEEGLVACRSTLPYTLHLHLTAVRRDTDRLETAIDGDLVGSVRWLIHPHPEGTDLRYEQDVVVAGRALGIGSYLGRPVLRWNHHRMMLGCRRGLMDRLAVTTTGR